MAIINNNGQSKVGVRPRNVNMILDLFPGASVAYSVRKLKSSYTGAAMRIRRSSDNSELNIMFDSIGNLDMISLSAFCGTSNGYVVTWYDQSGNGFDMSQQAVNSQPLIWNGSAIYRGTRPAIFNTSSGQLLKNINAINLGSTHTFFSVIDFESTGKEYIGDYGTGHSSSWAFYQPTGEYGAQRSFSSSNTSLTMSRALFSLIRVNTVVKNFQNGTQLGSQFSISNNNFWFSNLSGEDTNYGFVGYQQECIIYTSDKSINRSAIENNINSYYSLY
jgi:hypothetical protein